jgi:hypothetical protein
MSIKYLYQKNINFFEIAVARNYTPLLFGKNFIWSVKTDIGIPIKGKIPIHKNYFYSYPIPENEKFYKDYDYYFKDSRLKDKIEYMPFHGFGVKITKNEKHLKRHYNNPFASINIKKKIYSVYEKGDIIYIRYVYFHKNKGFNTRYFTKKFDKYTISFHKKTGNFITRYERKSGGKIKSSVILKQNNIRKLLKYMNEIFIYSTRNEENNSLFGMLQTIKEHLGIDYTYIEKTNGDGEFNYSVTSLLNKFVKERNIKVPNDYAHLLISYYPTEKFLKRNDRKLIQAILDKNKLKCKQLIKLMNSHPKTINLSRFMGIYEIFGDDFYKYLPNFNLNDFVRPSYERYNDYINKNNIGKHYNLTKKEKTAVILIINDVFKNYSKHTHKPDLNSTIRMITDHLRMIKTLKDYYPDLKLTSTTYKHFNEEHLRLSRINNQIRKEYYIEMNFLEDTIKKIENPIGDFYPVLLKREDEYQEEGQFMHHCVSSYINSNNCVIISIRNKDGSDRITNEYDIRTGECLQSRYFCNDKPPEIFNEANSILNKRVKDLANKKTLKWTDKRKVPFKINGKEITITKEQRLTEPQVVQLNPFEDILF